MLNLKRIKIFLIVILIAFSTVVGLNLFVNAKSANFIVYDSLRYTKKPNIGMSAIWVTGGGFWKNSNLEEPDETACRKTAREAAAKNIPFVIDIEHWPTDIRRHSKAEVQQSMNKIIQIVQWMKDERPKLKIGLYSIVPMRDYAAALFGDAVKLAKWQDANAFLAPLAKELDFIAPSLYTTRTDRVGWVKYAIASISEARKYRKPVIPFVWPRYHEFIKLPLKHTFIPSDYWLRQLQTVRKYADGVILWDWSGFTVPNTGILDTSQPWWITTKKFVEQL